MRKNAKQYVNRAKQARTAKTAAARLSEKIGAVIKMALKAVGGALGKFMLIVGAILLLIMLVVSIVTGLMAAIGGNAGSLLGLYLSEDAEIYAAENYANSYAVTATNEAINGLISAVPTDYVSISPYTLSHNPYSLISFLSAYSFSNSGNEYDNSFTANSQNIKTAIEQFIANLYYIQYSVSSYSVTYETTDADGNTVTEVVTYTVLNISVMQRSEDTAAEIVFNSGSPYTPEMYQLYQIYMETLGFRKDLFPEWV
jgi:hypothetical protein